MARIFNTYGPYMQQADGRVASNFIVQALRDEPITLYGDGTQTRSFCYVSDLVDAVRRLMDTGDELRPRVQQESVAPTRQRERSPNIREISASPFASLR